MRLIDIVYFLFMLTASFDPTGFHSRLKDLLFAVLVIYGLIYCFKRRQYIASINRITILGVLLIPLWGMFIAYITGNLTNASYAMGQVRSMLYIFIFFFMVTMRFEVLLKVIWVNGIILAVATVLLFFLSELGGIFLAAIYKYGSVSENYMMAYNRNFLGFAINGLYYKTGSLIIFSFIYNLYQYKGPFRHLLSFILFLSLFIAGSRTPMLVQVLILFIYFYDKKVLGHFLTIAASIVVALAFVMVTYMLATQENEASNEVKYDNFESYVQDISEGGHVIWGAGLGSEFYALGRGTKLSYSELSYMDILRMYGLPVGLCFIFLFFAPFFWLYRYFARSLFLKRYCWGYVLFLVLAGTNPLLLGSVGLTGLALFMAIANKFSYRRLQMEREQIEDRREDPLVIEGFLLR